MTIACSAQPPTIPGQPPNTSSPTANPVTPGPTATTVPATSRPSTAGPDVPYEPSRSRQSPGFTPAARTRTSSSSGPGVGTGTSRNASLSGPPTSVNPYARIRAPSGRATGGAWPQPRCWVILPAIMSGAAVNLGR